VGRIEVAQQAAGEAAAPSEKRPAEEAVEILAIQAFEEILEIMAGAFRAGDELSAADLSQQLELLPDIAPIQIQPVAVGINGGNRTAVQLTEQDIGQCLDDRRRSAFQDIGDPHGQAAVFKAHRAIGIGVAAELDVYAWGLGSRLETFEYTRIDLGRRFEKQ